jgi:hypothetical protein
MLRDMKATHIQRSANISIGFAAVLQRHQGGLAMKYPNKR